VKTGHTSDQVSISPPRGIERGDFPFDLARFAGLPTPLPIPPALRRAVIVMPPTYVPGGRSVSVASSRTSPASW
jgi:hypothetical protein